MEGSDVSSGAEYHEVIRLNGEVADWVLCA